MAAAPAPQIRAEIPIARDTKQAVLLNSKQREEVLG